MFKSIFSTCSCSLHIHQHLFISNSGFRGILFGINNKNPICGNSKSNVNICAVFQTSIFITSLIAAISTEFSPTNFGVSRPATAFPPNLAQLNFSSAEIATKSLIYPWRSSKNSSGIVAPWVIFVVLNESSIFRYDLCVPLGAFCYVKTRENCCENFSCGVFGV